MFLDADSLIKTSSQEETVNSSKLRHRKVERPSGLGGSQKFIDQNLQINRIKKLEKI